MEPDNNKTLTRNQWAGLLSILIGIATIAGVTWQALNDHKAALNASNDKRIEQELKQTRADMEKLEAVLLKAIEDKEDISNDEDDGVRGDFEASDNAAREATN